MPAFEAEIIRMIVGIVLAKHLGPAAVLVTLGTALFKASRTFRRWAITIVSLIVLVLLAATAG